MRRTLHLVALFVSLVAVIGACSSGGDDDDVASGPSTTDTPESTTTSGADADEFCAMLEESAEGDEVELDSPEGLESFRRLVDAAPPDLEEPMGVIGDALERVSGLDEDDPSSFGVFFEVFFDPEVVAAFDAVEVWGVENCDLPDDFFESDDDSDDPFESDDDTDDDSDGDDSDGDDTDDDSDDDLDTSALRDHIESTHGDQPPYSAIFGWFLVNDVLTLSFGADASSDDGMAVCEAASEYVYDIGRHDEVQINVVGGDGEILVIRSGASGSCASA